MCAQVAGLQDFREFGVPGDLGVFQLPCFFIVFPFVFSGVTYYVALNGQTGQASINIDVFTLVNGLAASNYGELRFKKGLYVFSDSPWILTHAIVSGEGVETILRGPNLYNGILRIAYQHDVVIRDLTLDGNAATAASGYCLNIFEAHDIKLINLNIINAEESGVRVTEDTGEVLYNIYIQNCRFSGHDTIASNAAIQIRGINTGRPEDVFVVGCLFDNATINIGYNSADIFIISSDRVTVDECTFKNSLNHAVFLRGGTFDCVVSNNVLYDCQPSQATNGAIQVANGVRTIIAENTITWDSNPSDDIQAILIGTGGSSSNCILSGNSIYGGGFANVIAGIYSEGFTDPPDPTANYRIIASNNEIYDTTIGIKMTYSSSCIISDNQITSSGTGIEIASSPKCIVSLNTVDSLTGIDLSSGNSHDCTVVYNDLTDSTTALVPGTGANNLINGNRGYNPLGNVATPYSVAAGNLNDAAGAQAFPTSATNYTINQSPKLITIYGGTITSVSIGGVATGQAGAATFAAYRLEPGQILNVVWTIQPSSVVYAC